MHYCTATQALQSAWGVTNQLTYSLYCLCRCAALLPRFNHMHLHTALQPRRCRVLGGSLTHSLTALLVQGRRFAATLGELTGGRVGLTCGSVGVLKGAVTIAIRYSAGRQQFGPPDSAEVRLFIYICLKKSFVIKTLAKWLCQQSGFVACPVHGTWASRVAEWVCSRVQSPSPYATALAGSSLGPQTVQRCGIDKVIPPIKSWC
jgi:hypothetical protein